MLLASSDPQFEKFTLPSTQKISILECEGFGGMLDEPFLCQNFGGGGGGSSSDTACRSLTYSVKERERPFLI